MVNMKDFVGHATNQSHGQNQPNASTRAQQESSGRSLKIKKPSKQNGQYATLQRAPEVLDSRGIASAVALGPAQPQVRNTFDSDYDGSEATMASRSYVQVVDSQVKVHETHDKQSKNENRDDEDDDGNDDYNDDDSSRETADRYIDDLEISQTGMAENLSEEQRHIGLFDQHNKGDSYPASTDGNGEPIEDQAEPATKLVKPAIHEAKIPVRRFQRPERWPVPSSERQTQYRQQSARPHTPLSRPTATSAGLDYHVPAQTIRPTTVAAMNYSKPSNKHQVDDRIVPNDSHALRATSSVGQMQSALQAGGYYNDGFPPRTTSRATALQASPPQKPHFGPSGRSNVDLDYDVQTLKEMSYDDLQKQSFDFDPFKTDAVLSETDNGKSVPERMVLVQSLDQHEKKAFLSTLTLAEWEEAGDWFLGRFGDLVRKMCEVRKERRSLAAGLEDEVRKRHELVQSKKRGIEEALEAMSKSGATILRAGTPSKKRKT